MSIKILPMSDCHFCVQINTMKIKVKNIWASEFFSADMQQKCVKSPAWLKINHVVGRIKYTDMLLFCKWEFVYKLFQQSF